ncbi:MAG: phage tail protein [Saprospiraceae bacterium]|nr:phage tail protein [Saprospiraceae bacterium]
MNNFVFDHHFKVEWGGSREDFTEVHGLTFQREVVLFRDGAQLDENARKLPGAEEVRNVVLRRYLKKGDLEMYQWWKEQAAQESQRDVVVSLLNKHHEPVFVWKLRNAFPARVSYSPLTASRAQPVVEEVELAFDSMVMEAR